MKKIILAIFLSLSVITFSSTSKNTEKEKELIKAKIEFFIGIIKTPYLYSYLAAKLNTTKNDDSFLSKENNEKIIEFFTNHIKNNKYIIKDIDVKNGKAVAYIDIIGIDFENYLPEIIIARRKILEQENSDNIEELQNLAFDLILLPLNEIIKDPNSKTKIQNIKIEFRKVNSEWKSEGIGYEKLLNMNDFFKIFENLETSSE